MGIIICLNVNKIVNWNAQFYFIFIINKNNSCDEIIFQHPVGSNEIDILLELL